MIADAENAPKKLETRARYILRIEGKNILLFSSEVSYRLPATRHGNVQNCISKPKRV
jgi:hypothetical protein